MCNALFSQFSLLAMLGGSPNANVHFLCENGCIQGHAAGPTTVPSTICRNESLGTTLHLLLNTKARRWIAL